jgi:putative ATPase
MIPLYERLRPKSLDEIVGQEHLVGIDGYIRRIIKSKKPISILLFGPPGSGKTTLARLYAASFDVRFKILSAVFSSVSDLKKIISEMDQTPLFNRQIILFVDEIHRFNKAQQDAFLPLIENGTIVLIGATTENPSFSLNNALLSRLTVLTLKHLTSEDLNQIIVNYEKRVTPLNLGDKEREFLIQLASGDGRYLLNLIENIESYKEKLTLENLEKLLQKKAPLYDKQYENHYNLISALHKSIRGSDPNAALYWLCRMLQGGEDPLFLARRMIRMASEDIGLADPQALTVALNCCQVYQTLGSPEGELALAEATVYLALAPKSNRIYTSFGKAMESAKKTNHLPPPFHILNAPTKLMKDLGYSKGYTYDHDTKNCFSGQNYFPAEMKEEEFYLPSPRGFERELQKRIDYFKALKNQQKGENEQI